MKLSLITALFLITVACFAETPKDVIENPPSQESPTEVLGTIAEPTPDQKKRVVDAAKTVKKKKTISKKKALKKKAKPK